MPIYLIKSPNVEGPTPPDLAKHLSIYMVYNPPSRFAAWCALHPQQYHQGRLGKIVAK